MDITNKELNSSLDMKSISKKWRFEDEETVKPTLQNQDLNPVRK